MRKLRTERDDEVNEIRVYCYDENRNEIDVIPFTSFSRTSVNHIPIRTHFIALVPIVELDI